MEGCKVYVVLFLVTALSGAVFTYESNNKSNELCTLLNTQAGACIEIKKCKPVVSFLTSQTRPISQKTIEVLRKTQCGFEGIDPKVCCPPPAENDDYFQVLKTQAEKHEETHVSSSLLPELDQCGFFSESRVYLGSDTELGSFPWSALLMYNTTLGSKSFCSGVIISKRYVLTAARCVSSGNLGAKELSSVRLGEHNVDTDLDCESFMEHQICADPVVDIPVEEAIIHERYNPDDRNRHFNIALLRLARDLQFTEFYNPICLPPLPTSNFNEESRKKSILTGWGITLNQPQTTNSKHKIFLNVKDIRECQALPKYKDLQLNDDHLCAQIHPGENICYVDDGGIIMSLNSEYFNYFANGLLTFDRDLCAAEGEHLVFTKISNYLPWIKEHIKP